MRPSAWLLPALAAGLATTLCGLEWGLPGPARWRALPPALRGDEAAARRLAAAWEQLYKGIERAHRNLEREEPVAYIRGVEEFPPGWTSPPDQLVGSVRSTLLRTEHPDEQKTLAELSRMRKTLRPLYIQYGGSFLYSVGAFLWLAAKARFLALVPDQAFYLLHPEAMGCLFLAGRLFIALFHVLTLLVVFDLARVCCDSAGAGALAALFLALCPVAVVQSHTLKPHVFAAFWTLCAVRAAVAAAESGRLRDFLLCGLCAGLGGGASFPMLAFGALPLAAAAGGRRSALVWRRAALGCALCAAVFAAANPYFFLARGDYLWETTVYPVGRGASSLAAVAGLFGRPLAAAMGGLLEALCALGLWFAFKSARATSSLRLCAGVLAAGALVLGLGFGLLWGFVSGPGAARFFYPLFGLACAVAACWAFESTAPRVLRAILVAAALLELAARSGVYLKNFAVDCGPESTRARAADWIEANIPAGAAIGLSRYPQPATTPLFRYDRYRLVVFEKPSLIPAAKRPPFVVVDGSGKDLLERDLPGVYELARAFTPEWTRLAPIADDGFFANAPMYVYRKKAPESIRERPLHSGVFSR